MPGYFTASTTKITMEKWGRADQYVVFANFDGRPFGEAIEFMKAYTQFQTDGATNVNPEIFNKLAQDIIDNIVEWGMTEHPVTEKPMKQPKTIAELQTLPFAVVMEIASGLTTTDEIPKES